jgi:lipoprotein-anchoring transpeptidase ErfK/SrfK
VGRSAAIVAVTTAVFLVAALAGTGCSSRTPGVVHPAQAEVPIITAPSPAAVTPPPPPVIPAEAALAADAQLTSIGIFPEPGAPPSGTLANPNPLGRPLVFLVKEQRDGWLKVALPSRPNGSTGWIQATDVTLRPVSYRIQVDLTAHRLTLFEGDNPVMEAPVAIGTDKTPTPTGDFYVDGVFKLTSPNGPYGAYALSVTGFSNVLTSFGGGNGQIAIHGTNDPALIGTPASHGCVRMTNADVTTLVSMATAGTPVSIVQPAADAPPPPPPPAAAHSE